MTPGLRSFLMLLGAVAMLGLLFWARRSLAARRARKLADEAKTIRLRQRLARQLEQRQLSNPIDWKPSVNGLDTAHLQVRHEPDFIVKEEF